MNRAKLSAALLLLSGVAGVAGACGSPPEDQPDTLEGAALVAGSSLERYGLLVVPRDSGVAQFRSIENPSTVRWTGRLPLEDVTAAHSLGSAVVLQRGRQLRLYTTSPVEAETPLPDAPADARWIAAPSGGAFVSGEWILAITPARTAQVTAAGVVYWAAPAAGDRVVALVEGAGGPELAVWEAGEAQPAATRTVGTSGPVTLAGWGRTVVTASEDGRGLVEWSIPELEPGEGVDIRGAPSALAISPSQHRVFAASIDRSQFTVIDRYDWREVGSSRIDAPLERLRPGMTGDRIVGWDGSNAWSAKAGEAGLDAVPGEWRPDLPLALPGGAVLVSSEGGLGLLRPAGEVADVEGPVDAWWLPFRWGRRLPVASAAVVPEDTLEDAEEALDALADEVAPARIGLLTLGRTANRSAQTLGDPVPGDPQPELPAGFYAVVQSSRQVSALGQVSQLFERSEYATHVLRRMDEAGDIWYRLLLGPWETRSQADQAARDLRRERGIDAWIHEEGKQTVRRDP